MRLNWYSDLLIMLLFVLVIEKIELIQLNHEDFPFSHNNLEHNTASSSRGNWCAVCSRWYQYMPIPLIILKWIGKRPSSDRTANIYSSFVFVYKRVYRQKVYFCERLTWPVYSFILWYWYRPCCIVALVTTPRERRQCDSATMRQGTVRQYAKRQCDNASSESATMLQTHYHTVAWHTVAWGSTQRLMWILFRWEYKCERVKLASDKILFVIKIIEKCTKCVFNVVVIEWFSLSCSYVW